MANEYAVNQADLTIVADAIRAKGKTDGPLAFPFGFASAIEGIKGGGDLNFEVVGGTTQPENPKENTIWVNTDQEITAWVFDANMPSNPVNGQVWLMTVADEVNEIDLLGDGSVVVNIQAINQYISGNWMACSAKIYKNKTWIDFSGELYLFAEGYGEVNGYSAVINTLSPGGKNAERIYWSNNNAHGAALHFTPLVDFKPGLYKNLCFDIMCTGRYGPSNTVSIGVGSDPTTGYEPDNHGTFDTVKSGIYNTSREVHKVDVSAMSGLKYVKFTGFGVTGYIYNVWLEW